MRQAVAGWRTYGVALLLLTTAAATAQDNTPRKVRQTMSDSIGSTQDFICSVSVQGSSRIGGAPPSALPELKAQAGIINGRELYARPAANGDLTALTDLLDHMGKIGAGAFALYTRPLFLSTAATFYAAPPETQDGRQLQRWDFTIPAESSRYAVTVAGKSVPLGYSGTLWADPGSGDLVRLQIRPDNMPPDLGVNGFTQTLTYARAKVAGVSVVLPSASELVVLETSGRERRTNIQIENCSTYRMQAGMNFIEGVKTVEMSAAEPASAGPVLPARLDLETTLLEPIDERTSPPGTPITLKVTRDVKSQGKVVVPKGALITGKVTRLSRQAYKAMDTWKGYYILGLALDTLEAAGQKYRLVTNLQTVGPTTILTCFLPFSEAPDKWGMFIDVRDELTFPKPAPGESILGVVREYLRVPKGLRLVWTTKDAGS